MTMQSEIIEEIRNILRSEVSDISDAVERAVDEVEKTFAEIEVSVSEANDNLYDVENIESVKQSLDDLYEKL